jgi:hypothetical protein
VAFDARNNTHDDKGIPMIDGLIAGKFYGQPRERIGKTGKLFVTAKARVAAGDGGSLFVNVITFDDGVRAALLALGDGDSVALACGLTPKVWVDKDGQPRPALDMVATQVLTPYHIQHKRAAMSRQDGS